MYSYNIYLPSKANKMLLTNKNNINDKQNIIRRKYKIKKKKHFMVYGYYKIAEI